MQYELHLNLRQRAALMTAISFWERKEVKDKTVEFLGSLDKFETHEVQSKWREFTKTVLDEWNKDVLPKQLEDELIHIIKMIGERILNWRQYIKYEYVTKEKALHCLDKIYWTPYGTVDVVKIFKSFWLENPNLDITKVYCFAGRYAIKEHINDLWDKIPEVIQYKCYFDNFVSFDRQIMTYWKHRRDNDLPNLTRYFHMIVAILNRQDMQVYNHRYDLIFNFNLIYDLNRSIEENMLKLSIHQGYVIATSYFWQKLTEDNRDEIVLKCTRLAVMRYYYHAINDNKIRDYKQSQYTEICIFLMNQMTERNKKLFFNKKLELNLAGPYYLNDIDVKDEVLRMLLSSWPWQELFIAVLKDMLQYLDDDSKMTCMFLDEITNKMVEDHKVGYFLENSIYQSLLREAWLIIPGLIKLKMVEEDSNREFICHLIEVWDLDSLNLILNDSAIAVVRDQFIGYGSNSYEQFVVNDQFEKLDQLIEELFKFEEEEKKSFKQKIEPWYDLLVDHKFDLADKFLDWQNSTPEERQSLKNNIDHMDLCNHFIEMYDFDLVDEFLDWKFETDEERKQCKDRFKSDIFVVETVYDIWKWFETKTDEAKYTSTEWLEWVLKSDEEIARFKKEKLSNLENNELILLNFYMLNNDGTLDDFLSWCALNDEEVQQIKQAVIEYNVRL